MFESIAATYLKERWPKIKELWLELWLELLVFLAIIAIAMFFAMYAFLSNKFDDRYRDRFDNQSTELSTLKATNEKLRDEVQRLQERKSQNDEQYSGSSDGGVSDDAGGMSIRGDSYTNSGTNMGHIGPVQNFQNPTPYNLSASDKAMLLSLDRSKNISIGLTLTANDKAKEAHDKIKTFLLSEGFEVVGSYTSYESSLKKIIIDKSGDAISITIGQLQ